MTEVTVALVLIAGFAASSMFSFWKLHRTSKRALAATQKLRRRLEALERQMGEMPTPEDMVSAIPDEHKKVLKGVVDRCNTLSNDLLALRSDRDAMKLQLERMLTTTKWGRALGFEQREKEDSHER